MCFWNDKMAEPQTKHLLPFQISFNNFVILVQVLLSVFLYVCFAICSRVLPVCIAVPLAVRNLTEMRACISLFAGNLWIRNLYFLCFSSVITINKQFTALSSKEYQKVLIAWIILNVLSFDLILYQISTLRQYVLSIKNILLVLT